MKRKHNDVPMEEFLQSVSKRDPKYYCKKCKKQICLQNMVYHKSICKADESSSGSSEAHENEIILDKTLGGPDLLTDAFLEEEMERQPRKFTIHCVCFLFAIIFVFFLCKWFSIRIIQSKSQDSQLDIMMKR